MKLAMLKCRSGVSPAVIDSDGSAVDLRSADLPWSCLEELIAAGETAWRGAGDVLNRDYPRIKDFGLAAPLRNPQKIMCIGQNYADHVKEMGKALPERPVLFAKFANALTGPGEEIILPEVSSCVDYEAELAVVIGRRCRNVEQAVALDYVFGYTCANDITMRDAQKSDGQWTRAKSPDTFCPIGPWIVTVDEIEDPQALDIRLELNGSLMQNSNTRQMVFTVTELISYLSRTMTLLPGDILLTGTPPGVGAGRNPQVFIRSGDRMKVTVEGVGELINTAR